VEYPEVTVCIAARAENVIFGISDRMLTSGDVQFEPTAGSKLFGMTNSLFAMTAGDAGLQANILSAVNVEVQERITREPTNWWLIRDVADLYIKHYNIIRKKRAEDAILGPLYLNSGSFVTNQNALNAELVGNISKELLNFSMPRVSAIIAGLDPTGTQIYLVDMGETNAMEAACLNAVGFVAIGSGGRHASSQFMFARHAWNAPFADTLFLSYYAKRKAEVAPGVGQGTDMVVIGPGLGTLTVVDDRTIRKLETEYQKVIQTEKHGFSGAKEAIKQHVEDLQKQQTAGPQQPPPPKTNGGTTPPDGPKAE
jgi:hypothetical protein